jgi:hypothetical protein
MIYPQNTKPSSPTTSQSLTTWGMGGVQSERASRLPRSLSKSRTRAGCGLASWMAGRSGISSAHKSAPPCELGAETPLRAAAGRSSLRVDRASVPRRLLALTPS